MLCRTSIILFTVRESDKIEADLLIPKSLKTIPETSKIHQITWGIDDSRKLFLRQLSCTKCCLETVCTHFPISKGSFEYQDSPGTQCLDTVNVESRDMEEIAEIPTTASTSRAHQSLD